MTRAFLLNVICMTIAGAAFAQAPSSPRNNSINIGAAIGSSQGAFTVSFIHDWRLGKKQKFVVGFGARSTSYFGANQYYTTAPAKLTSGSTGPGVLFKGNIEGNIDTFLIARPNVFAINTLINLGYHFNEKFSVGFNIDALGFSFGGEKKGNYINGFQGQNTTSKPTAFNALLIGDNDRGSLNSELYAKYRLHDKWSLKAGLQFLFTEYTTETNVQQFPQPNDRFRNKSLLFTVGASIDLN